MPAYYDVPLVGNATVNQYAAEDVDKFQKLPFYLVKNEIKTFPQVKCWDLMFGSQKWTPNMGSIMRGARPEYSPIGNTFVFPTNITTAPTKNVFETLESIEEARVKHQRFESKQIHFLPSFQDFWDNHLKFASTDITRQISFFNEQFIRGMVFFRSPNIFIAGNNGGSAALGTAELVTGCPVNDPAATVPANGKTATFLADVAASVGQTLTLKVVAKALQSLADDLRAPTFDGTLNAGRDNELVKGKYVLVTGSDAWTQFTWDPTVTALKSLNLDLVFDGFKGSLFGQVTTKLEQFPIRMDATGAFIAPEVVDVITNKTRPNPAYTSLITAPFEWAFLCGSDAWKTLSVGPPPREFASQSMSAGKFYKLRWNGEVQLTDQLILKYPNGEIDLNRYGTHVQLISQAVFGALAGEVNNILPICFRRARISTT